jgi:hypothetical protein
VTDLARARRVMPSAQARAQFTTHMIGWCTKKRLARVSLVKQRSSLPRSPRMQAEGGKYNWAACAYASSDH